MTKSAMARKIEQVLRARFPNVIVKPDRTCIEDDCAFDVYFIPEAGMGEYMVYRIYELPDILEPLGLGEASLISNSTSATRRYFPEIKQTPLSVSGGARRRKPA